MAKFRAKLKDPSGKSVSQTIDAESPAKAREAWRQKGFTVIEISAVKTGFNFQKISLANVTIKDKALFSRQLATLVNAGVSMVRGLGVMLQQATNPKMKAALTEILADVEQGTNFSDALRKHPDIFDRLYVAMVQAGETGGVLDDVLNRLAKLLEDAARLENQIKSAMTYPVIVSILAILIFVGMCKFIIPVFAGIFQELGSELPAFTQFLVNVSNFLNSWMFWLIPLGIFALMTGYKMFYSTPFGRLFMDRLFLKLPVFGDLVVKTAVARFSRTFGSLSRAGVPILSSLEITGETAGNAVIEIALNNARQEVKEGGQITPALERQKVFPPMALQMLSIGEETGELDKMLMKIADFYENEVEEAIKALTSIMEPFMILFLGGMVGSILAGMYLPIFKIMNEIK
jgi:type IV pilus assembly protein PilC